jgi:hypothetical protein
VTVLQEILIYAYNISFLLAPINWVILALPRVRRVLARHRVLVAVTMLPIQPALTFFVISSAIELLPRLDIYWEDILFVIVAYLNGLVAFLVVIQIQELVSRRTARSGPVTGPADGPGPGDTGLPRTRRLEPPGS